MMNVMVMGALMLWIAMINQMSVVAVALNLLNVMNAMVQAKLKNKLMKLLNYE